MMAIEVVDISRREVKRWVDAGTLECRFNTGMRRNLDDDYMLVGVSVTFDSYNRVIRPFVAVSYDDVDDMKCAARMTEPEEIDNICGFEYCYSWEIWHLVDDWYDVDSHITSYPSFPFSPWNIIFVNCDSVSNRHSGLEVGDIALVRRYEYFNPGNSNRLEIGYDVIASSRNLSFVMRCIDNDLTDFHMYFDFDSMRWCLVNDELWYVVGPNFYDNKYRVYYKYWNEPYADLHFDALDPDCGICVIPYMFARHDFLSKWKAHPVGPYDARCYEPIHDFSMNYLRTWFVRPFGDSFTIDDMRAMFICLGWHGWVFCSEDEDNDLAFYVDVYNRRYYAFGDDYESSLNDLKRNIESLCFVANDYDREHDYFKFVDIFADLEELRAAGDCEISHDQPLECDKKPQSRHVVLSRYDDGLPF